MTSAAPEAPEFSIAIYIPDRVAQFLRRRATPAGVLLSNVPELDFLPPPWWEQSHTTKLGVIQAGAALPAAPAAPLLAPSQNFPE